MRESWNTAPLERVAAPLREQVIQALRQAIRDFELKPGQRLVERELVETLGVSRTTVREAIRELASEGLVAVIPQRGAIVNRPSIEDAVDLYELRMSLEALVTRRFVERATDDEVDALGAAVENFARVAAGTSDIRTILAAKDGFYAVLIAGARSQAFQQLLEGIQARVQVLRATSLSEAGRATEAVQELRAVAAAAKARDAEGAAALCAAHVRRASETALRSLREVDEGVAV